MTCRLEWPPKAFWKLPDTLAVTCVKKARARCGHLSVAAVLPQLCADTDRTAACGCACADVHGSRVPALLEQAVARSMEALQRVAAEGTRAGVKHRRRPARPPCARPSTSRSPASPSRWTRWAFVAAAQRMCNKMQHDNPAFRIMFSVNDCRKQRFCLLQVSAGVLQNVKDSGTAPDRKLLLLLSNCAHVRTTLVPALSEVRVSWAMPELGTDCDCQGPKRPVAHCVALCGAAL